MKVLRNEKKIGFAVADVSNLNDGFLLVVPRAPAYLNTPAKKYFKRNADILIKAKVLKVIHLEALCVLADNLAQKEWAVKKINEMNKEAPGSGYKQDYKTGATNITTELVIKRDAEKRVLECLVLFGMDPKSEKNLGVKDTGQTSLFDELRESMFI